MDQQQIEKDLNNLNDLPNHPGFKALELLLEDKLKVIEEIRGVQSEQVLFFRQGQLDIIDFLMNLQTYVDFSLKEMPGNDDADY